MRRSTRLTRLALAGSLLALVQVLSPGHRPKVGRAEPAEKGPRGVVVEQVRNDRPAFVVRVDVDHANRVYKDGDVMQVKVMSEKAGYLYLLYESADEKLSCLFPNKIQRQNQIPAHREITVPAPDAEFRLRVGSPYGTETLMALVTLRPIEVAQLGVRSLTEKDLTPLLPAKLKGVVVELKQKPADWAEHHVRITTLAKGVAPPTPKRRRCAVFIGISRYKDRGIRDLHVCHKDAQMMQAAMKRLGNLDSAIVLTDGQATLENIRKAICKTLVQQTRPGDEVFIFWSGHGGRCADHNGDEKDGYDEYLVPYDARLGNMATIRKTMLIDDTFGRWMQDLDGRKVVLMLDTCHSAGQATLEKGLGQPGPAPAGEFDFLDGELARAKDVGQRETALLCAAKASQIAFERRERDLSVMTYFLCQLLAQRSQPVTLTAAYEHLKIEVPRYIKKRFPGATQTPVLVSDLSREVYIRQ